jgi:UDP-glucose 4-epimerase
MRIFMMHDQRVLVTGGGFIGSNLANHCAEDNDVIAVDDTYLGTLENVVEA